MPDLTEEQIAASNAADTVERFESYYREFVGLARQGYPAVTNGELEQLAKTYAEQDPVMHELVPVLSRVHKLITQHEASRRATQLTYAIHLHRARTGRWPQSLDELSSRYAAEARVDPFTKRGLRLSPDGRWTFAVFRVGKRSRRRRRAQRSVGRGRRGRGR